MLPAPDLAVPPCLDRGGGSSRALGTPWSVVVLAIICDAGQSRRRSAWAFAGRRDAEGCVHAASRIGLVAMGLFSSLFVLTLLRDLGRLGAGWSTRRARGGPTLAGAGARWPARGRSPCSPWRRAWGFVNARRTAAVRRSTCRSPACRRRSHGFTIAQISDMHVGPTISADFVERDRRRGERAGRRHGRRSPATWSTARCANSRAHVAPLGGPALAPRHLLRDRQPRVLLGRRRLDRELRRLGLRVLLNEHVVDRARRARRSSLAGVTDFGAPLRPRRAQRPERGARRRPAGRVHAPARAPAAQRRGGRGGRLRPAALGAHPRRPVPAVEPLRAAAAAVHRRPAPLAPDVGLHQPRHRLLGPAEALRRAIRDHPAAAGAGTGRGACAERPVPRRPVAPVGSEARRDLYNRQVFPGRAGVQRTQPVFISEAYAQAGAGRRPATRVRQPRQHAAAGADVRGAVLRDDPAADEAAEGAQGDDRGAGQGRRGGHRRRRARQGLEAGRHLHRRRDRQRRRDPGAAHAPSCRCCPRARSSKPGTRCRARR